MTFPDFLQTGKEPFNETPSLQTQEFSHNLPREVYAQDIVLHFEF